jgi:hypothetical protein
MARTEVAIFTGASGVSAYFGDQCRLLHDGQNIHNTNRTEEDGRA